MFKRIIRVFIVVVVFAGLVSGVTAYYGSESIPVGILVFFISAIFAWMLAIFFANTNVGNEALVKLALGANGRPSALIKADDLVLPPDEFFDHVCAETVRQVGCQSSYISFVFADRQLFKGIDSLPDGFDHGSVMPLEDSICRLVAAKGQLLSVDDTTKARHVKTCGPVKAGFMGSYLGAPVFFNEYCLGALTAVGSDVRKWTKQEQTIVSRLANVVTEELTKRNLADDLVEFRSRKNIQPKAER